MNTVEFWEVINRDWEIDEEIRRNYSYYYPREVEETDENEMD